jgi:hypothetical protein
MYDTEKKLDKSEDHLKALQSVGQVHSSHIHVIVSSYIVICDVILDFAQIVGEVLRELTEEKCTFTIFMSFVISCVYFNFNMLVSRYCQGCQWTSLCCGLQATGESWIVCCWSSNGC